MLLSEGDFNVVGKWEKEPAPFGFDFWYQPAHNVMISTGLAAPKVFKPSFNPTDVAAGECSSYFGLWNLSRYQLYQFSVKNSFIGYPHQNVDPTSQFNLNHILFTIKSPDYHLPSNFRAVIAYHQTPVSSSGWTKDGR